MKASAVSRDPDIMGGAPVFAGTRDKRQSTHSYGPADGLDGNQERRVACSCCRRIDAFVTVDRNLAYQQNIANLRVAVTVLRAKSNRLADLSPLVPKLLATLGDTKAGRVSFVGD
jgi:hypothetical protein